ncbi:MAG: twitching motility protein PilT [Actinomycetota bacterium]|nr:twitching motility protein PilT [Actinomycetota bacterium]
MILDAGALVAAERNERDVWLQLHLAFVENEVPIIPSPVLAQVWRDGPRQARLAQLVKNCHVESFDADAAKVVGIMCGKAGTTDIVDASVVHLASVTGFSVMTSDPRDLKLIGEANDVTVQVIRV